MSVKFLFKTIMTDNDKNIDLEYLPSIGHIVNKITGKNICRLPHGDMRPYINFKIEFEEYHYDQIYQPGSQTSQAIQSNTQYKNIISKRIYHLYMYLNIKQILSLPSTRNKINQYEYRKRARP